MDWLPCKPAMNPLQRNLDQSHNLVRPTDGMELKARTSSLVSRGWISRERNPVTGGVFLLTSFLIELSGAIMLTTLRRTMILKQVVHRPYLPGALPLITLTFKCPLPGHFALSGLHANDWSTSESRAMPSLVRSSSSRATNRKGCKQPEVNSRLAASTSAKP